MFLFTFEKMLNAKNTVITLHSAFSHIHGAGDAATVTQEFNGKDSLTLHIYCPRFELEFFSTLLDVKS